MYKYHYAERPKHERTEITAETEVPAPISKEQRLKNPDRPEFDAKMKTLDAQIEAARNKIQTLIQKKRDTIEGGKMKGTTMTFKDFFKTRIDELKAIRAQKNEIETQKNKISDKIEVLQAERANLQKTLPQKREEQDPINVQKVIEDMQKRYETTTLKPAEEKKMLADMKKLKESIPFANRLLEIKPAMDALYEQRKVLQSSINVFKGEIDSKSAELDAVRKEQDEAREQRDDIKQQLDKFSADIDKVKEDLNKFYAQKDELREEFHKQKLEFEIELELIRHTEWITREKERLVARDTVKQERLTARK